MKPLTPRVDAEASDGWTGDAICVGADFARTLETELNAANERVKELKRIIYKADFEFPQSVYDYCNSIETGP